MKNEKKLAYAFVPYTQLCFLYSYASFTARLHLILMFPVRRTLAVFGGKVRKAFIDAKQS